MLATQNRSRVMKRRGRLVHEGSSSELEADIANLPEVTLNGIVDIETTIPVSIIGGTATPDDYTLTANEITIPVGSYRNDTFPLPLVINDNFVPEPDETIILQLGTPSTSEIVLGTLACDGSAAQDTSTYTIINDDAEIQSVKTVAPFDFPIQFF